MDVNTCSCCKDWSDSLPAETFQPLVSVVVPVYKVEDVLARCLDSLCRQSLREIEIIMVDDASPDRCGEICEQYAERDARFKVIHHPDNRGLSIARNTGIAHASADYLMFVDSDDWVHKDFCKLPYECAVQQQADLVMFCRQSVDKNGSWRPVKNAKGREVRTLTHLEAIDYLIHVVGNAAWNKIYSRKLFQTVSYPEGYFYEDIGTTYKMVLSADTICYLDDVLYYYCYHEDSITMLKTEKALSDCFQMQMCQYRDLAAWGYPAGKLELLLHTIALEYCIQKKSDADDANYVFCRNALQSSKMIPKDFTWRRKVLFLLLKYCPPLFDLVCEMYGKRWD